MVQIKSLTRFNYWNHIIFNPLLMQQWPSLSTIVDNTHAYLSQLYQYAHQNGDAQGIFYYAKEDTWAFREPWVIKQVEAWRTENTPESLEKLVELMHMYCGGHGRGKRGDSLKNTLDLIKRDQGTYKRLVRLRQTGLTLKRSYEQVQDESKEQFGVITLDTLKDIYKKYQYKVDELMGTKTSRRLQKEYQFFVKFCQKSETKWGGRKWNGWKDYPDTLLPEKPVFTEWEDVFRWLDTMQQRLEQWIG